MKWSDLFPPDIAIRQTAWEREQRVYRLRQLGLTHREIANRLGVSRGLIWALITRGERRRYKLSPIEKYQAGRGGDVADLARKIRWHANLPRYRKAN